MPTETTRELLTTLADFLDTLPEDRFDYRVWVGADWRGATDLSCGTTACAAGWATTLPAFRERGLYLERRGQIFATAIPAIVDHPELGSLESLAYALETSVDDVAYLFVPNHSDTTPDNDATAHEVAEHIRAWMARQTFVAA